MSDAGSAGVLKPLPGKTDENKSEDTMKILVGYDGSDLGRDALKLERNLILIHYPA